MLTEHGDGIWCFEQDVGFVLGSRLATRTTVLRGDDGGLVLHAPLRIDDGLARELAALGEVTTIIAPSCMHYMFVEAAAARYPEARVLGPAGLEAKLPRLAFERLPEEGEIAAGLRVRSIDGVPSIREHVFLHERSRSLVVTDLVFNLHDAEDWRTRLLFRLVGAYAKPAQGLEWRLLTKDREAAQRSVGAVLAWSWDRLVMAHGRVVAGAHGVFADAVAWMAGAPRSRG